MVLAGAASLCVVSLHARGDEPATTRPALDELNREIHSLYQQAQDGMLHVQLPPPQWINNYTLEPINKYPQIDAALKQRIAAQQQQNNFSQNNQTSIQPNANGGYTIRSQIAGSTAPGAQHAPAPQPNTIIVVQAPTQKAVEQPNAPGGPLQMNSAAQSDFVPTHVGLVLDDKGHVLVPIYLEPEACTAQPIRLADANGQIVEAKFIGSDRPTNLTVVQVDGGPGRPMPLGDRIDVGSVCLFVSPIDGAARLGVWTGGERDWGYVLATDGHVAGVARAGQILSGSSCRLIANEIEQYGVVRRPTLGVVVRQTVAIDSAKNQHVVMQVLNVLPDSAAEKAGFKPRDIFELFDGQPISDVSSLAAAMAACSGKTVIQIQRDNASLTLSADLVLPIVPTDSTQPDNSAGK
jgi:S1-C subfamily serine protease